MQDLPYIQSRQNNQVKKWRRLLTQRGRRQQGEYIIENHHLVEEAIHHEQPMSHLLMTKNYYADQFSTLSLPLEVDVILISQAVAKEISSTTTSQGVFAVLKLPTLEGANWEPTPGKYLLLDGVQDPGNLGTLIRTAAAAAFDGVFLGQGTVDPYNDKVLRAAQGSLWQLPLIPGDLQEIISKLQSINVPVWATDVSTASIPYQQLPSLNAFGLILGNEGRGVDANILELADCKVHIPMPGVAESLNVGVAGGILMFHLLHCTKNGMNIND